MQRAPLWGNPQPLSGSPADPKQEEDALLRSQGKDKVIPGVCPHTGAIPSAYGLLLLPLVLHVFTEVHAITEGVAPAVYQTFSPELQLLGWDGRALAPWGCPGWGQLVHCL